jgi:carboxyl-terminal processing protease
MAKINKTEKWTFSLTLVVALAGATLLGGFYGNHLSGAPTPTELHKRLKEYTDLLSAVSTWAPEDITSDKFVYSSIDGMLRTLDPHTSFLEPKEYTDMQDRQKGTFYGLGGSASAPATSSPRSKVSPPKTCRSTTSSSA